MGRSAPASMIIALSYPMIRTLILLIAGTGLDRDATRPVTARHAFASSDVSCLRCFSCRCVVHAKAKLSEQMTPTPLLTRREQVQTLIAETSIIVEKRLTRQGLRGPWMHCRCCRCCRCREGMFTRESPSWAELLLQLVGSRSESSRSVP